MSDRDSSSSSCHISPRQMEVILMSHPCITDAGIIEVTDENTDDEVLRAYVVRSSDANGRCSRIAAGDIHSYIRGRFAGQDMLRGGVCFVAEIPKTAEGQVQRLKLAQMDHYRYGIANLLGLAAGTDSRQRLEDRETPLAESETSKPATHTSFEIVPSRSLLTHTTSRAMSTKSSQTSKIPKRTRVSLLDKLKALESSQRAGNAKSAIAL